MTWIVKVGDQYLKWHKGGSARCSKKQKDAIRFNSLGYAYKVAHRTFGLGDENDEDDWDMCARVVKLVPRAPKTQRELAAEVRSGAQEQNK
jgi:hypothetical protein